MIRTHPGKRDGERERQREKEREREGEREQLSGLDKGIASCHPSKQAKGETVKDDLPFTSLA